jgi:mannose-6-phosphate isomerase-like protein (cupin superfamily)
VPDRALKARGPATTGRRALLLLFLLAGTATAEPPAVIDTTFGSERTTTAIDTLLERATLRPGEAVRVTEMGRDGDTSHHLVVLRDREPLHRHDRHALIVHVLRGSGVMHIDGVERPVGPRSLVHVPRGAVHAFLNRSDAPAVAWVIYTPPFDGHDRQLVERREPVAPAREPIPAVARP